MTSEPTFAWDVSQHTDTSKNTKAALWRLVGLKTNLFKYKVKIQCKLHEHTIKPYGLYPVCSFTYMLKRKGKHTYMADEQLEIVLFKNKTTINSNNEQQRNEKHNNNNENNNDNENNNNNKSHTQTHTHARTHVRTHARTHARARARTHTHTCLLYTSPSPRDSLRSRMPSSA